MPDNTSSLVRFVQCTKESYESLGTYTWNTIYYITDTKQIYVGDNEYTKSILTLDSSPSVLTEGEEGRLYYYNGSLYTCKIESPNYIWTRVANVNDFRGTVTSVNPGDGLDGDTITTSGTINHAVPSGASAQSDSLHDVQLNFGQSVTIQGVSTDKFGHIVENNLHTITLQDEPEIEVDTQHSSEIQPLSFGSTFSVVTDLSKGENPHEVENTITSYQLPTETVYSDFIGTDGIQSGQSGLVPGPLNTDAGKFLMSNGTWAEINQFNLISVLQLPTTDIDPHAIYLVPNSGSGTNVKDEYIYINGNWEKIGTTEVDLSGYVQINNLKSKGSTIQPVYFDSAGNVQNTSYTIEKSVPSNAVFTDTTYSVMEGADAQIAGKSGLVPKPLAGSQNKYLKGDGTWSDIPDRADFIGATSTEDGQRGLVPAPRIADKDRFLKGDGTWAVTPDTTYQSKSAQQGGTDVSLVTTGEKYTWNNKANPSNVASGTYKSVTINNEGIVTSGTNPTTLSGYGITDANINNGVITLGSNTITPLTSHQDLSDYAKFSDLSTVATTGNYNDLIDVPEPITVDSELSTSSVNPVQNKILTSALNNKADTDSIPTKVSELDNDSGYTSNVGTVTQIDVGPGLYIAGLDDSITTSGQIKLNINGESEFEGQTSYESDREYLVGLDRNGNLSVNVPWIGEYYNPGNGISITEDYEDHYTISLGEDAIVNVTASGNEIYVSYISDGSVQTRTEFIEINEVNYARHALSAENDTDGIPFVGGYVRYDKLGVKNGVAQLDNTGRVPSNQLPSYVDDVLEYISSSGFPKPGETGKIYVDTTTNKTYRWSGTTYVEISSSLALGNTSSTAYRGDYGEVAYNHATDPNKVSTASSINLYKLGVTSQGHISTVTPVDKSDITNLGIPGENTQYTAHTTQIPVISSYTPSTPTSVQSTTDNWGFSISSGSSESINQENVDVVNAVTPK